jgi:predicted nucleic acid-binding protein
MELDPKAFAKSNFTDTCSIWNLLSSKTLLSIARQVGCDFLLTEYVVYECLVKPRSSEGAQEAALKSSLVAERTAGRFSTYRLSVEDLQDLSRLHQIRRLGRGELTSIVLAEKFRIAFLTDDKAARKLGNTVLGSDRTQTVPHLVAWLTYEGHILDGEKAAIVQEHAQMGRPLAKHIENGHLMGLQARLDRRQ